MNIARAETDHAIAGLQHSPDFLGEFFPIRLKAHRLVPVADHFIHNGLAGDAGDRRLTRRIHIRDQRDIGVAKRASEFLLQLQRSRIAMRLEHAQHPLAPGVPRGRQRRLHLARMMPVIVHDHVTLAAILDLEATARAAKCLERLRDIRERNTEFRRQRDHTDRVADVVAAGNVQRDRTERLARADDAEVRLEILRVNIVEPIKGEV